MSQEIEIREPDEPVETIGADDLPVVDGDETLSVEDFIRELEAKERDLHIGANYHIEIADPDVEVDAVPDFVKEELQSNGNAVAPPAPFQSGGSKTRVFELEKEVNSLNQKLAALKMERDDVQKKSDQRLKDFESFKYRTDRERRGAFITQVGNVTTQMLPVMDNLDRALESISGVSEKKRNEFKQFFDGVSLVHQQLNEVLAGMGVEPIATVGEEFDPDFHEAVVTEESSDQPPNTISAEMLRGYRIGNLVIRHSMVKVIIAPAPTKAKKKTESKQDPPDHLPEEPTDLPTADPPHNAE
jgi:molecular chaperone GrpE